MNIAKRISNKNKEIFQKDIINLDEMYYLKRRYICKYYDQNRGFCINKKTRKYCPYLLKKIQGCNCTALFAQGAGYKILSRKRSIEEYHSAKRIFVRKKG